MDLIPLVVNILYNKHIKPAYIKYTPNIDVEYISQKYYYVELNIITQILREELKKKHWSMIIINIVCNNDSINLLYILVITHYQSGLLLGWTGIWSN